MDPGVRIENLGKGVARYGLATVVGGIGAEKFTEYEAKNIEPLLVGSPLFSWLVRRIGLRGTARLVGATELGIAGLLVFAPKRSRLSTLGSALAVGMFGTTLSFLFSTSAARTRSTKGVPILADVGQFLVKDLVFLGTSLLILGESLSRRRTRWRWRFR